MKKGFTMLEILVGASIITASFLGVLTVFDRLSKSSRAMVELTQAGFLVEEALEAARTWRDSGWANLGNWPANTDYYLAWSGSRWATSTANVFLDGKFERRIRVTAVSRGGDSDIVSSGGTDDPETKLVTATVAWWSNGATTSKNLSTYLTDLFN